MEEVRKFAEAIQPYWAVMEPVLTVRTEGDYDRAVARLNQLVDEVGDDATHPLYGLLDTLGTLGHAYEVEHVEIPQATGVEELQFLMK
jgi:HTH-type transcriptional regulator/antitoxin HigA